MTLLFIFQTICHMYMKICLHSELHAAILRNKTNLSQASAQLCVSVRVCVFVCGIQLGIMAKAFFSVLTSIYYAIFFHFYCTYFTGNTVINVGSVSLTTVIIFCMCIRECTVKVKEVIVVIISFPITPSRLC